MDARGNIYDLSKVVADIEEWEAREDAARLDGYLRAKAEQGELARAEDAKAEESDG